MATPKKIKVVNGKFKNFSYQQLESLFQQYLSDTQMKGKPMVLYLHGGGVSFKKVSRQIKDNLSKDAFREGECFPIYWMWSSGVFEVVWNNLMEEFKIKRPEKLSEGLEGNLKEVLDSLSKSKKFKKVFKKVLKRIYKKIKKDTALFESNNVDITRLNQTINKNDVDWKPLKNELEPLKRFLVGTPELEEKDLIEIEKELKAEEKLESASVNEFEGFLSKIPIFRVIRIFANIIKRFARKTHHGVFETVIEEIIREFLHAPFTAWWTAMKSDINQGFPKTGYKDYAGSSFLHLLEKYWHQILEHGKQPPMLVATSAGAIYACKILAAMHQMRIPAPVQFNIVFLVPAISFEEFHKVLAYSQHRIKNIRIFGMSDQRERKDNLALIYTNSILYLVSGILEKKIDEPLLGMQRFYRNERPYRLSKPQNRVLKEVVDYLNSIQHCTVWAPGVGNGISSEATAHLRITGEAVTLNSINYIINNGFDVPQTKQTNLIADVVNEFEGTGAPSYEIIEPAVNEFETDKNISEWDEAYFTLSHKDNKHSFVEPDITHDYLFRLPSEETNPATEFESFGKEVKYNEYNPAWPPYDTAQTTSKFWHLEDSHSGLKSAIAEATKDSTVLVRIAHIDTGYDPNHSTFPAKNINDKLEKNFVKGEEHLPAIDPLDGSFPLKNPGHGTGTLGILAGKEVDIPEFGFKGPIGLTKNVEIVPIRIAESVLLFKTSAFCKALEYIITLYDNPDTRIHIVSMSMGGLASKKWADLVNKAYEKGIFIVTAGGNNFGRATPHTLVYPARFNRVLAACGATYNFRPYSAPESAGMQGNYGPLKLMNYAMSAFTPNIPWAKAGTKDIVELSGAGTSSATPQIAMAAALYYIKHFEAIEKLKKGFQKIEVIRNALFESATKEAKTIAPSDFTFFFGRGILNAKKLLTIAMPSPAAIENLKPAPKDKVRFPLIKTLFGFEATGSFNRQHELEVLQLLQTDIVLQEILDHEEKEFADLSDAEKCRFYKRILAIATVSNNLKTVIRDLLERLNC